MRKGGGDGRGTLSAVFFGLAVALVYYVAFCTPARLLAHLRGHNVLAIGITVLWAILAAYCWRRVVQAVLRLCGFG
jgi:hypothetical protein